MTHVAIGVQTVMQEEVDLTEFACKLRKQVRTPATMQAPVVCQMPRDESAHKFVSRSPQGGQIDTMQAAATVGPESLEQECRGHSIADTRFNHRRWLRYPRQHLTQPRETKVSVVVERKGGIRRQRANTA